MEGDDRKEAGAMWSRVTRVLVSGALALTLAPAWASGAPASGQMDVQVWLGAEPGQVVIVVGQVLDPATTLPATVRLPLPPDAQVVWAGEIIATGTGADDPAREYEVVAGAGGDSVEFTASESRNVQIETIAGPVRQDGDLVSADIEWVQSEPASVTAFSVRLPPGATDIQIEPPSGGPPDANEIGETLYALPLQRLEPGQATQVAVSYRVGTGAGAAPSGTGGSPLLPWLIGGFLVAAGALVFLLFSQRTGAPAAEDDEAVPEPGDEGYDGPIADESDEGVPDADAPVEDDGAPPEQDGDATFLVDE